jgi:fatty-acyl-CoA synthase
LDVLRVKSLRELYRRGPVVEYTVNKISVKAIIVAESFKSSDYVGVLETLAPEIAEYPPGELQASRVPQLRLVAKIGAVPAQETPI